MAHVHVQKVGGCANMFLTSLAHTLHNPIGQGEETGLQRQQ